MSVLGKDPEERGDLIIPLQQTWEMVGLWVGYYPHLAEEETEVQEVKINNEIK